jgi:hypothetical protein
MLGFGATTIIIMIVAEMNGVRSLAIIAGVITLVIGFVTDAMGKARNREIEEYNQKIAKKKEWDEKLIYLANRAKEIDGTEVDIESLKKKLINVYGEEHDKK